MKVKLTKISLYGLMWIVFISLFVCTYYIGKGYGEKNGKLKAQMEFYQRNKQRDSTMKSIKDRLSYMRIRLGIKKEVDHIMFVGDSVFFILSPDTVILLR